MATPSTLIDTGTAAAELGVSRRRVQQLIDGGNGPLRAVQIGRDWLIDPADLDAVRERASVGWPKGRPRGKRPKAKGRKSAR